MRLLLLLVSLCFCITPNQVSKMASLGPDIIVCSEDGSGIWGSHDTGVAWFQMNYGLPTFNDSSILGRNIQSNNKMCILSVSETNNENNVYYYKYGWKKCIGIEPDTGHDFDLYIVNNLCIAVGYGKNGVRKITYTSNDGINWSSTQDSFLNKIINIEYKDRYWASTDSGIFWSDDMMGWNRVGDFTNKLVCVIDKNTVIRFENIFGIIYNEITLDRGVSWTLSEITSPQIACDNYSIVFIKENSLMVSYDMGKSSNELYYGFISRVNCLYGYAFVCLIHDNGLLRIKLSDDNPIEQPSYKPTHTIKDVHTYNILGQPVSNMTIGRYIQQVDGKYRVVIKH